jgi:hypothetical protein
LRHRTPWEYDETAKKEADVDRMLRTVAIVALLGLLAAIVAMLVSISLNGIRIDYAGDIRIVGMPEEIRLRMAEPVTLTMPGGTTLTATVSGVQSAPLPIAFASAVCPECGGAMLPVRYDVLSGKIEWACPVCGKTGP